MSHSGQTQGETIDQTGATAMLMLMLMRLVYESSLFM